MFTRTSQAPPTLPNLPVLITTVFVVTEINMHQKAKACLLVLVDGVPSLLTIAGTPSTTGAHMPLCQQVLGVVKEGGGDVKQWCVVSSVDRGSLALPCPSCSTVIGCVRRFSCEALPNDLTHTHQFGPVFFDCFYPFHFSGVRVGVG